MRPIPNNASIHIKFITNLKFGSVLLSFLAVSLIFSTSLYAYADSFKMFVNGAETDGSNSFTELERESEYLVYSKTNPDTLHYRNFRND